VIVVDTNVVCYRWMASPLWRSEFRNAFTGAVRKRLLTAENAIDIIEKAEAQLAGREFLLSSRAVMRLVAASRCSAYDCEFVALAEEHGIALVTVDGSVLRDFNRIAIPLDKFVRP
jgi:predicted nucleic acid-binding protein